MLRRSISDSYNPRNQLVYQLIGGATNLSKQNARIWEQNLINQYGIGNLHNKIKIILQLFNTATYLS